jgi:hypothetical protein
MGVVRGTRRGYYAKKAALLKPLDDELTRPWGSACPSRSSVHKNAAVFRGAIRVSCLGLQKPLKSKQIDPRGKAD